MESRGNDGMRARRGEKGEEQGMGENYFRIVTVSKVCDCDYVQNSNRVKYSASK
jgi:hypothetical protein